jgi:hypothetical protein
MRYVFKDIDGVALIVAKLLENRLGPMKFIQIRRHWITDFSRFGFVFGGPFSALSLVLLWNTILRNVKKML